ncbi:MAG: uroporphyrinogen decarboxylase, partial [Dechloromonas sp.]|nr:uroporphyrinogen decarboxylase [Dechloromonas sp.]
VSTGADVMGVSWTGDLRRVRDQLPENVGVQGNLDPVVLNTNAEVTLAEAERVLSSMEGTDGFIFNLGHGISQFTPPESVTALVEAVHSHSRLLRK